MRHDARLDEAMDALTETVDELMELHEGFVARVA